MRQKDKRTLHRVSVYMYESEKQALEDAARAEGVSVSSFIRRMLLIKLRRK